MTKGRNATLEERIKKTEILKGFQPAWMKNDFCYFPSLLDRGLIKLESDGPFLSQNEKPQSPRENAGRLALRFFVFVPIRRKQPMKKVPATLKKVQKAKRLSYLVTTWPSYFLFFVGSPLTWQPLEMNLAESNHIKKEKLGKP